MPKIPPFLVQKLIPEGTEAKEEWLKEIHKLQAEEILSSEEEQDFRGLKNYIERTLWQAINQEYVKSEIVKYRGHLDNARQKFDESIETIEKAINHVDGFKHWLVHSIHESQRALQFQKKVDQILKSQGIDQYRDGADRTFGKPWI